jgi:L-aspartate oxidase
MHPIYDERRYLIPFRSILLPQIFTDTLVLGAGAAGLSAALAASEHGDVIVVSKAAVDVSNTSWAQGGVAGVVDAGDTVDSHVRDTLAAGGDLCEEAVVRRIVASGPDLLRRLVGLGFRADRDASGGLELGREGGHSARRIVHADGDATGAELSRSLAEAVRGAASIRLFDRCFTLDLITAPGNNGAQPCLGAITHHPRFGLQVIWARATILASGGAGAIWRETTNPPIATGDGVAMAYRAGAEVADLAFMQFHPTALYVAGGARTLISEAVRGEGATLVDQQGRRFMVERHERAELAPRDVVARGIQETTLEHGLSHVWLDARGVERFAERFPGIARALAQFELDPARDLIPVNPAAHYMVGGVRTDLEGRTAVPGLYAVGEVACTGLHGANRLASNSLLEALVMGDAAGRASVEMSGEATSNGWGVAPRATPAQVISDIPLSDQGELDIDDVRSSVRSTMWRNVGVGRGGGPLADVVDMFDFWARYTLDKIFDDVAGWEVQNMLWAGALVARSALWREESRGCHARADFPEPAPAFAAHDLWRRGAAGPGVEPVGTWSGRGAARV